MERYASTIDKASHFKNGPNNWSREHNQPRYILDLLLLVIALSCKIVDTVNSLPKLNFSCTWICYKMYEVQLFVQPITDS